MNLNDDDIISNKELEELIKQQAEEYDKQQLFKKTIIGKTIKSITPLKRKDFDDTGFMLMEFTDNTNCLIVGDYGGYTGNSADEYPTDVKICYLNEQSKYEHIDKDTVHLTIDINNLTPI